MKRLIALLALTPFLSLPVRAQDDASSRQALVVELFAAQGCNLCLSAEDTITKIAKGERGYEDVLPLVYHLDKVDSLGWKDRFASDEFTTLYRAYVAATGAPEEYVPLFVVQGEGHTQQSSVAESRIKKARTVAAAARVQFKRTLEKNAARIDATVSGNWKNAELFAVAFENDLVTPVNAGLNKGKTLSETAVVRRLSPPALPDSAGNASFRLQLSGEWKSGKVGFAVVARDRKTMKILGAARIDAGAKLEEGAAPAGETVKREGDLDVMTLESGALAKISSPKGLAKGERPSMIVVLHGWGGDPDGILRFMRGLGDHRHAILCAPKGSEDLGGSGFGWDPEKDVAAIADFTRRAIARYNVDPARVSVLGFSAGGSMAALMCIREKELYNGCVACAITEVPSRGSDFEGVRGVFFLGDKDPNFSLADEGRKAIKEFSPNFAFRIIKDLGHETADPIYLNDALNFLAQTSEKGDEQTLPRQPAKKMAPAKLK